MLITSTTPRTPQALRDELAYADQHLVTTPMKSRIPTMTMADAMVKATTEKKDVTFHAQVVLVKHIPNTYGTMTALMCGAQLNDGRTCRRSVMLNQSCKNGHAPHLQTLGHDKDTRYEFKVCARDLSASDEAASFSVVLVLFDNCMLTLTEGIPAKTMRGSTESEKSNFVKHIVGLVPEPKNMEDHGFTQFALAMTEELKDDDDPIQAYRNFYMLDKATFAAWKHRDKPEWWDEELADYDKRISGQ